MAPLAPWRFVSDPISDPISDAISDPILGGSWRPGGSSLIRTLIRSLIRSLILGRSWRRGGRSPIARRGGPRAAAWRLIARERAHEVCEGTHRLLVLTVE